VNDSTISIPGGESNPLYAAWQVVLQLDEFCDIIEGPVRKIYAIIGDALHGWLLTAAPPYAVAYATYTKASASYNEARSALGQLPEPPFDLRQVRTDIIQRIGDTLGLTYLINEAKKLWSTVPHDIRAAACGGIESAVKAIAGVQAQIADAASFAKNITTQIVGEVMRGEFITNRVKDFTKWLLDPSVADIRALIDRTAAVGQVAADVIDASLDMYVDTILLPVRFVPGGEGFVATVDGVVDSIPSTGVVIDAHEWAINGVADVAGIVVTASGEFIEPIYDEVEGAATWAWDQAKSAAEVAEDAWKAVGKIAPWNWW
jgi:hypothetical protein